MCIHHVDDKTITTMIMYHVFPDDEKKTPNNKTTALIMYHADADKTMAE